ncbi:hypothetical protein ACFL4G_13325, partial [Thermodesulfobacteriota bacterium]
MLDNDCDDAVDQSDTGCIDCSIPEECDDGNACTDDDCIDSICTHVYNTAPCDDQNACTDGDECSSGVCIGHEPLDCDDDNVCTDDACHPDIGCYYTFNTNGCNDQDPCTMVDTCSGGACSGAPLDADDDAH